MGNRPTNSSTNNPIHNPADERMGDAGTATKSRRRWTGDAPSNIALIKYMGKIEGQSNDQRNRPTNASLSYTLSHLRTHLDLEWLGTDGEDRWEPLVGRGLAPIELSVKGQERFLRHLGFLKKKWNVSGSFVVRSANDFPSDCGLASSASSFAALTKVAVEALTDLTGRARPELRELADLSRQGSGSSCRSFSEPWVLWDAEGVSRPQIPYERLIHQVVVVESGHKAVSSSEAHRRVSSSLLFQGRPERAEKRLVQLTIALRAGAWRDAMELCWAEFWDMHALFESSAPSFGYMTAGSLEVLSFVRESIWSGGDGPLVTMDAGANVHLLYRPESAALAERVQAAFGERYQVLSGGGQ